MPGVGIDFYALRRDTLYRQLVGNNRKRGAWVGEESLKSGEAAWISKLAEEEKQRLSK